MREKRAKGLGWDVFESGGSKDGYLQIQRLDRTYSVTDPAFDDDHEAIQHVIAQAKKGDTECIDALWEVLDQDDLVNRILWCQAMGWKGKDDAAFPE